MAEFTPAQKEVLFKIALDTTTQAKELAMKESEARIAAMANNVFTPSSSVLTVEEDNDAIGELPLEARKVTAIYLGLPRKEIAAIYKGKFIPENLYKLRMLYGRDNKDWTTQFTIGLSGDLQFKRIKGTLKDFGNTTAIWSTGFLNYSGIISLSSVLPMNGKKQYCRWPLNITLKLWPLIIQMWKHGPFLAHGLTASALLLEPSKQEQYLFHPVHRPSSASPTMRQYYASPLTAKGVIIPAAEGNINAPSAVQRDTENQGAKGNRIVQQEV
ncbi:MAG: hypothetical protein FRX48_07644 [Lasallia pustulata]|uniref:Uncharacterized protein n=1 Tax=Lasallia pustulata TaxID=136370 RepID=A0A5M8PIX9_9LECA|nr:MAG: hypothetical protein FRX48_07644 [Lasallia pustulata]